MDFFGPDFGGIGRDYEKSVNSATKNYVGKMEDYADVGRGANIQNQQQASAVNFGNILGDVNSFLDPSMSEQIKASTDALKSAYGAKGSLFSGAAGNAIAENARAMAERGWSDAYGRANQAKQQQFQNQMGIDAFNNNASQTNFQNKVGVNTANFGNFNDIYGTELGNKMNIANKNAELAASEKSGFDYLMDAGKLGVSAMATMYGGPLGGAAASTVMGGLK